MFIRQISIEHAAPWLVSSASGLYIMARARRLSLEQASRRPIAHFLLRQSDVILMLCSCPALWHYVQRRRHSFDMVHGSKAQAIHQLRQVFTALLVGTGLLKRKLADGKTEDLHRLAQRLDQITHEGLEALAVIGEPYAPDLLDEHGAPIAPAARQNGMPL